MAGNRTCACGSRGAGDERLRALYETAIGRAPEQSEIDRVHKFVSEQAAVYGLNANDAWNDPRIWRDLCHVVYTLKEFVYIG